MSDGYAGTWMSATEAMAMLGCSSPTFYRWRANDPELCLSTPRKWASVPKT